MTVDEYLALSCSRKGLNPMEHFVRVKKRRDMEDHNYFVPHRTDSIETYVKIQFIIKFYFLPIIINFNIYKNIYVFYSYILMRLLKFVPKFFTK